MTAILYVKDDGIYSDHLFVDLDNIYNQPIKNYHRKIFRSNNNQFVYALSGRWIFQFENNRKEIEKMLHDYLFKIKGMIKISELPGDPKKLGGNKLATGNLFILTLEELVVVDFDTNTTFVHSHENHDFDYYGIGSGGLVAEAVLRLTGNPELAIQHCDKTLSTCGLSDKVNGGKPDYQPQSTLEPLKQEDDVLSIIEMYNQIK